MNNQTLKNDPDNRDKKDNIKLKKALRSIWLGRQDSNLRMPVPKTGALPLGHAPTNRLNFSVISGSIQLMLRAPEFD